VCLDEKCNASDSRFRTPECHCSVKGKETYLSLVPYLDIEDAVELARP